MISRGEINTKFGRGGEVDPVVRQVNAGFHGLGTLVMDFSLDDEMGREVLVEMEKVRDGVLRCADSDVVSQLQVERDEEEVIVLAAEEKVKGALPTVKGLAPVPVKRKKKKKK